MQSCSRRVRGALSLVCSVIVASAATAQQPQTPLTLPDAIALAAKQGPAASAARSALNEARARDRAFSARLLPQIQLQGDLANYNHSVVPVFLQTGETVFAPQRQNESYMGVSVTQALPWLGG